MSIELLGLPVRQFVFITARDEALARSLHLEEITDGEAPESWVARREATLELIAERHYRSLTKKIRALSEEAPADLEALLRHIANCAPCQSCLEACPVGARKFGNLLDPESEIRKFLATKRVFRFKEEFSTYPKFFYYVG